MKKWSWLDWAKEVSNTESPYPVVGIESLGKGVYRVKRKSLLLSAQTGGKRKKITMLSQKSRLELMAAAASCPKKLHSMLTLTYPAAYPSDGEAVKEDLRVMLQWLRRKTKCSYIWFLEFQKRGAPHVHVLTTIDCVTPSLRGETAIKWTERVTDHQEFRKLYEDIDTDGVVTVDMDKAWLEVAKVLKVHMHPKTWEMAKSEDGLSRYAVKYATKTEQKEVPDEYSNVGRFWGTSQDLKVTPESMTEITEDLLRKALQQMDHSAGNYEYIPKYLVNAQELEKNIGEMAVDK